ncbi:MAG: FecR domain-containing protein [Alphaproteobacteria bacterium]
MKKLGHKLASLAFLAAFAFAGFGLDAKTAFAGDRSLGGGPKISTPNADKGASTAPRDFGGGGAPVKNFYRTRSIAGTPGTNWQGQPAAPSEAFSNGKPQPMTIAAKDRQRDLGVPEPESWSVTNFVGDVKVRVATGAVWKPLARAVTSIAPGMQVKTGPDGKFSLQQGKDVLTVSPNSEIEIPTRGDDNILQSLGKVLFDMERRPDRRFSVGTPYLAATIKGTVFTVTVDALSSTVDVHEGAVQVASLKSSDITIVRPGQSATVTAKGNGRLTIGKGNPPATKAKPAKNPPPDTASSGGKPGKDVQLASLNSEDNSGKGKGQLRRIETTLGVHQIDVASVTSGLIANWSPGGTFGNSGNGNNGLNGNGPGPDNGNNGSSGNGNGNGGGSNASNGGSGNSGSGGNGNGNSGSGANASGGGNGNGGGNAGGIVGGLGNALGGGPGNSGNGNGGSNGNSGSSNAGGLGGGLGNSSQGNSGNGNGGGNAGGIVGGLPPGNSGNSGNENGNGNGKGKG